VFLGKFNLAKDNIITEEVKACLFTAKNKGRSVFHMATNVNVIEIFQGMFNFAKENLRTEEEKIVIRQI
jgi:hypothetical protein